MAGSAQLNALAYKGVPATGADANNTGQLNGLPYEGSSADASGPTSEDCRQAIRENGKPFRLFRARPVPVGDVNRRRDGRALESVDVSGTVALFDESDVTVMTEQFGPLQSGRIRMKTMPDEVTISRLDEVVRTDAYQNALWAGAGNDVLPASGTVNDALPIPYVAQIVEAISYHNGVKTTYAATDYAPTDSGIHWLTSNRPQAGDALFVHYIPFLSGVVREDEGRITGTGEDGKRMWQITMLELLRGEATS